MNIFLDEPPDNNSGSTPVKTALDNNKFNDKHYIFLMNQYNKVHLIFNNRNDQIKCEGSVDLNNPRR